MEKDFIKSLSSQLGLIFVRAGSTGMLVARRLIKGSNYSLSAGKLAIFKWRPPNS